MNQKVQKQQMNTAIDSFLTVLKDIERLRLQELSLSLQEQPVVWNLSTQWHTADVTLQMGQDGNISLSLTVLPNN